jgi:hypothetical protein
MTITVTSLTHPTMIAKIRQALYYAHKGEGHKMGGHDKRCYIKNAKGHNIMRLNWVGGEQGFIVYGDQARNITHIVKKALQRAKEKSRQKAKRDSYALAYSGYNPDKAGSEQLSKMALVCGLTTILTGCQAPGAMTALYSVLGGLFT